MTTTPVPLRLPKNLLEVAELRARHQRLDRASALRQLLHEGAEGYVLTILEEGRISLSRAAELLGGSTLEIHRLAARHGLRAGGDANDYRRAKDSLSSPGSSGKREGN